MNPSNLETSFVVMGVSKFENSQLYSEVVAMAPTRLVHRYLSTRPTRAVGVAMLVLEKRRTGFARRVLLVRGEVDVSTS